MINQSPDPAAITRFAGDHFYLSNFYPARVELDGMEYPSVEHAYQAAKTLDLEIRRAVQRCAAPAEAKAIGSGLDLRPGWETLKITVMEALLLQKFAQPDLRRLLLATGNAPLIEGNDWGDRIWGCTRSDDGDWIGENRLGRLLMMVRERLVVEERAEDS